MTKAELFDLIQDNWLSWKKKQQLKAAVEDYSSALLRQTDCSMLREIVSQEYNRLRDIANQYEGLKPSYDLEDICRSAWRAELRRIGVL